MTDKDMREDEANVKGVELSDELGDSAWQLVEGGKKERKTLERRMSVILGQTTERRHEK